MKFLLLIILIFSFPFAHGQKHLQLDSSLVERRSFNDDAIRNYRQDKAFQYEHSYRPKLNLWQRFWAWFWQKVAEILSTKKEEGRLISSLLLLLLP